MRSALAPLEVPLSGQRVAAFIALQRRPVRRMYVAGALWTDMTEDQANANLRTALWRLRRCGCGCVYASRACLVIGDEVTIDYREVEILARRAVHDGAQMTEREITSLYGANDLLPDWYDDWVSLERERLRQLRIHALEALCESFIARRRYGDALDAGLAAVSSDPLRESSHRLVIKAHLAEGNLVEATRHYDSFRQMLRRDVGLRPSPQMESLLSSVR